VLSSAFREVVKKNEVMMQFKRKKVIVWLKKRAVSFALTLISRTRFDASYLSSNYLQELVSMTQ
jgi:hypothetical protein